MIPKRPRQRSGAILGILGAIDPARMAQPNAHRGAFNENEFRFPMIRAWLVSITKPAIEQEHWAQGFGGNRLQQALRYFTLNHPATRTVTESAPEIGSVGKSTPYSFVLKPTFIMTAALLDGGRLRSIASSPDGIEIGHGPVWFCFCLVTRRPRPARSPVR